MSLAFLCRFEYKASKSGFASVRTESDCLLIKFEYNAIKSGFASFGTESDCLLTKFEFKSTNLASDAAGREVLVL